MYNHQPLINACISGDLYLVKSFIKQGQDMCVGNNYPIRAACEHGHTHIVKELLKIPKVNPSAFENAAIVFAAMKGHIDIVKVLLADSRVDPCEDNNRALHLASWNNYFSIINLLLSDSRVFESGGLDIAIKVVRNDDIRDALLQRKYAVGGEKYKLEQQVFREIILS